MLMMRERGKHKTIGQIQSIGSRIDLSQNDRF